MHRPATAAAPSDEELMRSVQADDDRAFELLYNRYQNGAWQLASLLCRGSDCADRIVHDAFIVAWHERAKYRPDRETARAWATRLIYRRAAHPGPDPHAERSPVEAPTGLRDVGTTRTVQPTKPEALPGVLQRLPESQRQIIALAFYGGLTHTQIAELLALPPGTVKGRMRLGLQELRGAIDQHNTRRQ